MSQVAQPARTAGAVGETTLPADLRALSSLARIDYSDTYVVPDIPTCTAEQWARAVLLDAPLGMRTQLLLGWTALGLKLVSPVSDRGILGWPIQSQTPEVVVLSAGSRLGLAGNLVFARRPEGLLFATLTQQNNPVARAVWGRIIDPHHRIVRSLLRNAASRELQRRR
jgi:hypothetical protein